MVLLRHPNPSRKRPSSSFVPPLLPSKTTKPNTVEAGVHAVEKMVSILAECGCTLINTSGPPCLPADTHNFRRQLSHVLSSSADDRGFFLDGFSSYIESPQNLHRVLIPLNRNSYGNATSESFVRHLLLVPSIQLDLQNMLLEKLPEYFNVVPESSQTFLLLEEDVARLIISQFRWLDFMVDPSTFTNKLMQVLSICPLYLKKEIIGSLPEIIGGQDNKTVVDSLEQMLQEDSAIIVPVLDSLSNLNLDDQLQEQVITIALSCIRTVNAEHMPYLLRFLLLSATQVNVRRIISRIREQLKFVGASSSIGVQHNKLKGKLVVTNTEQYILDALRSSLRFKNILCQEILKELDSLEKPGDHKVIDIWLLVLMYSNGESMRRCIEKVFKKKTVEGCFQYAMLDQCICANKDVVRDYFQYFLYLSEYLLKCKEKMARDFGIHTYIRLFEELADTYSRQEVLGALITHVGCGVDFEVSSALQAMVFLAAKHVEELTPLSSHINGILDYLEGFTVENIHQVYEIFSRMALSTHFREERFGSSIANELMMVVQKQVSHPDMKYKKMGLIGILKIISCVGGVSDDTSSSLEASCKEVLKLLETSLESCKQFSLPLVFFYDELTLMLETQRLHPAIMEWISQHVGDFESLFLSDLEGGMLPNKNSYNGLEGELWMNLDGDMSPVCLNILPLASATSQSDSLQYLPAKFLLLSAVERMANQGSLGGIDALLGCPLHLPSSKYFSPTGWQSLTHKQKQIACISVYYAVNWIRELLNAFSTQDCASQVTKEDIVSKLVARLRNLIFLEGLLNHHVKKSPISLPQLHLLVDHSGTSPSNKSNHLEKKIELKISHGSAQPNKKTQKKISKTSKDTDGKLKQLTLLDVFNKAECATSQQVANEVSSDKLRRGGIPESRDQQSLMSDDPVFVEVYAVTEALDVQRYKFRPLHLQCFSILTFLKMQNQKSCCCDPEAELPLCLYLLRDLLCKLDNFASLAKLCTPTRSSFAASGRITVDELLSKIRPLFPILKRHFSSAFCILNQGKVSCQEHWKNKSAAAGHPDIVNIVPSESSVSTMVFKEVITVFNKMLSLAEIQRNNSTVTDLLEAFQPDEAPDAAALDVQTCPAPGTVEYLCLGACLFFEGVLDTACYFSFSLASESLFTLESVFASVTKVLAYEEDGKTMKPRFSQFIPSLRGRLATSAYKLLKHDWNEENLENGWRNKVEIVQKILRIYLECSVSTIDLVNELACSILPKVFSCKTKEEDDYHGFPTLCSSTFLAWYRVLFEVNIAVLNKLVKEVRRSGKLRPGFQFETVEGHLDGMQKTVNVVVVLVNMCKTYDKVSVHALAVKYGGKFIDAFLKAFDFLEIHFQAHDEVIIQMVKELQKATRIIQTLCSEAKGMKQMAITGKIPATKRSLERFLFRVKGLLHATSSGCTFWMGNLKHKDLKGQVVSSQAYLDDKNESTDEYQQEAAEVSPSISVSNKEGEAD